MSSPEIKLGWGGARHTLRLNADEPLTAAVTGAWEIRGEPKCALVTVATRLATGEAPYFVETPVVLCWGKSTRGR